MKSVYIVLKGEGPVFWMENLTDPENYERVPIDDQDFNELEEDGWLDGDLYEVAVIKEGVEVSVTEDIYTDDGIDITKSKGKYVLAKNYFSHIIGRTTPFYCMNTNYCQIEEVFKIDLNDDEEFDSKKLQLIKSDYEVSFLPYAIVSTHIIYDGKMYKAYDPQGYDTRNNEQTIYDEEQPYASSTKAIELSLDMIVKQND